MSHFLCILGIVLSANVFANAAALQRVPWLLEDLNKKSSYTPTHQYLKQLRVLGNNLAHKASPELKQQVERTILAKIVENRNVTARDGLPVLHAWQAQSVDYQLAVIHYSETLSPPQVRATQGRSYLAPALEFLRGLQEPSAPVFLALHKLLLKTQNNLSDRGEILLTLAHLCDRMPADGIAAEDRTALFLTADLYAEELEQNYASGTLASPDRLRAVQSERAKLRAVHDGTPWTSVSIEPTVSSGDFYREKNVIGLLQLLPDPHHSRRVLAELMLREISPLEMEQVLIVRGTLQKGSQLHKWLGHAMASQVQLALMNLIERGLGEAALRKCVLALLHDEDV